MRLATLLRMRTTMGYEWVAMRLDNALIAAGLLEDARDTVSRMNTLMAKAMG